MENGVQRSVVHSSSETDGHIEGLFNVGLGYDLKITVTSLQNSRNLLFPEIYNIFSTANLLSEFIYHSVLQCKCVFL